MTALQALSLYAGLNILLILALSMNVVSNRRRAKISLGAGGDPALETACRAHGNAIEYALPGLAGLIVLTMMSTDVLVIHGLGIMLTLGRLLHAFGLLTKQGTSMGRVLGISLNWLGLLATGGLLVWSALI
jgi:uncharacterized membrane protein YecN with MAPEG domain